jgi:L-amino acid N-acyltransferase YncA
VPTKSVSLHESRGFEEVGVLRDAGRKAGQWVDRLMMQRVDDSVAARE